MLFHAYSAITRRDIRMSPKNLRDLWGKAEASSVSYAPSIAVTDYSEFLPTPTETDEVMLVDGYNANAVLNSAWISLKAPEVQMPWDGDFWDKFWDKFSNS